MDTCTLSSQVLLIDLWLEKSLTMNHRTISLIGAAAVGVGAYFIIHGRRKQHIVSQRHVLVATNSGSIPSGIRRSIRSVMHASKIECVAALTSACEQPLSIDAMTRGACARLKYLSTRKDLPENLDYAIVFEHGVIKLGVESGERERWLAMYMIALKDLQKGTVSFATTPGVEVPSTFIGDWAEAGQEGTINTVIAEQIGCADEDPFPHLTSNTFDLSHLFEQALAVSLSSLSLQTPELGEQE